MHHARSTFTCCARTSLADRLRHKIFGVSAPADRLIMQIMNDKNQMTKVDLNDNRKITRRYNKTLKIMSFKGVYNMTNAEIRPATITQGQVGPEDSFGSYHLRPTPFLRQKL